MVILWLADQATPLAKNSLKQTAGETGLAVNVQKGHGRGRVW